MEAEIVYQQIKFISWSATPRRVTGSLTTGRRATRPSSPWPWRRWSWHD